MNQYGVFKDGDEIKIGPTRKSADGAATAAQELAGPGVEVKVVEAANKADARTAYEAGAGTVVAPAEAEATTAPKVKAEKLPPLTEAELEAVKVPRGKFSFPMSGTGMAYHPSRTIRGGIHDVLIGDTPDLEDYAARKDAGEIFGSVRGTKVRDLDRRSCQRFQAEVDAAEAAEKAAAKAAKSTKSTDATATAKAS